MKTYALFLGCTVPVRGMHYEVSARLTAEKLGIHLVDVKDFGCCGFPLEGADHLTSFVMSAMSLAAAERQDLDIVTLCSACTATLTKANKKLKEDRALLEEVNKVLSETGAEFKGKTSVKHFVRLLVEEVGYEKIRSAATNPLTGLKIAAHYGCHYLKPSEIYEGFDSSERPVTLDRLIEAVGATHIDYEDKLQCCGGGILGFDEISALKMTQAKLQHIKDSGADAMTFICPFCAVMYDANQKTAEMKVGGKFALPGLYFPQLLGLSMGFSAKEMALDLNRVKVNLKLPEAKK